MAETTDATVVKDEDSSLESRLSILKSRLSIAKSFAKKPHKAWREYIKEYEIEDVNDTDEIRDKVRIGYIFRHVESDLPAIFDDQPELFIKGKGKNRILDPLIEGTYDYLWDTQNLEETIEDAATFFLLLGMGFVESPWVTKTTQVPQTDEMGQPMLDEEGKPVMLEAPIIDQPMATAGNVFDYFFSPETKFAPIMDYDNCPYYFKKHVMTVDEVDARFGKKVDSSEMLKIEEDEDTNYEIDHIKENIQKDDMKRVTVWEYYGCLPSGMSKGISGSWSYDKEYHIWMTDKEELKAEECPYEYKPLFVLGNYGLANKFFKFGDAKHLKPLVQELERYRTQILRHTRKMANPKTLVPEDANVDEKNFRDPREGVIVKYQPGLSGLKPEYLSPSNLGSEVGTGIQEVRQDLEKTSGSFDLSTGGSQSSVRTPRGIATFSEAADKNVRRKRKKIARLIRQIVIFQFKQLAQNWTPDGTQTIDVVAEGEQEQLPVVQEVLDVLGDDHILAKLSIEIESLSVNRVQMKQDALDLMDTALKFEQVAPGLINLEELFKDVMQNAFNKKDGDRFINPPEVRQQMMEAQAQAAAPQQAPKGPSESIRFGELPPEGKIQLAAKAGIQLSPEGIAQQDALSANQSAATVVAPMQGGVQNA